MGLGPILDELIALMDRVDKKYLSMAIMRFMLIYYRPYPDSSITYVNHTRDTPCI